MNATKLRENCHSFVKAGLRCCCAIGKDVPLDIDKDASSASDGGTVEPISTISGRCMTMERRESVLHKFLVHFSYEHRLILKRYFMPVMLVHRYSGWYLPPSYRDDHNRFVHLMRFLFITVVVILASYQFLYVGYYLVSLERYDKSTTVTIVVFSWSFQSIASLLFVVYWQRTRKLERVLVACHVPQRSAGIHAAANQIRGVTLFGMSLAMIVAVTATSAITHGVDMMSSILPRELFTMYGDSLTGLAIFIFGYTVVIGIMCTMIYVLITIIGDSEFRFFNRRLMMVSGTNESEILERLLQLFKTHRDLANAVRTMDHTFQVYAFVMIGTNIPAMTFSLLSLISSPSKSYIHLLIGGSSVAFCFIQLVSLTAVPAKLHGRILQAEELIYSCRSVWYPFNEKIYSLAGCFIAQVKQHNLGVSLWGFTVVSKPSILTTISLTATYLTFVLQLKSHCECDSGDGAINGTVNGILG